MISLQLAGTPGPTTHDESAATAHPAEHPQLGHQRRIAHPEGAHPISRLATSDTAAADDEFGRLPLTQVARIDPSAFADLAQAVEEKEGLVDGLIQTMNDSIARHLTLNR